jgi:hypothetical protein
MAIAIRMIQNYPNCSGKYGNGTGKVSASFATNHWAAVAFRSIVCSRKYRMFHSMHSQKHF